MVSCDHEIGADDYCLIVVGNEGEVRRVPRVDARCVNCRKIVKSTGAW